MIARLKQEFSSLFITQPLQIKIIIILTASIFLPLYITAPVVLASFAFILSSRERRKAIAGIPHIRLLALLGILLLVTPTDFKNYCGLGCGFLMIIYFVFEIFINSVMTGELNDRLCSLCCAMSVVNFAAATVEKIVNSKARVSAFSYNANFYGYIAEMVILICFYKFIQSKKPVYLFVAAANVGGIFLADCRSAWSGLLVGFIVLFAILKMRKSLIAIISIAAAIIGAMLFNHSLFPRHNDIGSITLNRFQIWNTAFKDFLQHPVFGRGLLAMFQITGNTVTPHAHNIYIDLLECTGIVGTAILIFLFVIVIKQLSASFKSGDANTKRRVALCWAAVAATLAHGVTDMQIMGVHTGLFFFFILAMRPRPTDTKGIDYE